MPRDTHSTLRSLVSGSLLGMAAKCLAVPAALVVPAQAETATVSFSGTYAPLWYNTANPGAGGSFQSTLDYDDSRSTFAQSTSSFTSDFMNTSGTAAFSDEYFGLTAPGAQPGDLCGCAYGGPRSARGLFQSITVKVSPGVYQIVLEYPVSSIIKVQEYPLCGQRAYCYSSHGKNTIRMGVSVNLGTDTSGYFDLSKLSFNPVPLSSICAGNPSFPYGVLNMPGDTTTTAELFRSLPYYAVNGHYAGETYKLSGSAAFTGLFYIRTTGAPTC